VVAVVDDPGAVPARRGEPVRAPELGGADAHRRVSAATASNAVGRFAFTITAPTAVGTHRLELDLVTWLADAGGPVDDAVAFDVIAEEPSPEPDPEPTPEPGPEPGPEHAAERVVEVLEEPVVEAIAEPGAVEPDVAEPELAEPREPDGADAAGSGLEDAAQSDVLAGPDAAPGRPGIGAQRESRLHADIDDSGCGAGGTRGVPAWLLAAALALAWRARRRPRARATR
jgi:uncharacterized protein (TIGR03382 family)